MSDQQNMSIDRVTLGVLGNVLHGISREMGVTMRRTSYSNIFNEGYDYTCGIFNAKGKIVVQDEHVPILIASMELTLERLMEKFGHLLRNSDNLGKKTFLLFFCFNTSWAFFGGEFDF